MDIRPLHTEDDYRAALADLSALVDLDPERGTPEGDRLEVLSTLVEHYETAHYPFGVTVREAFQRLKKISLSPEEADRFKTDIRQLAQTEAVTLSMPLVDLTDGQRMISVGVSGLAQFGERYVRAWNGEHVGEMVTFATEALARQALGPDLTAPETFEWVRQFLDDELPYDRFIAGRDAIR